MTAEKKSTSSDESEIIKSKDSGMYTSPEPYGPGHEHVEGPVYLHYDVDHVHVEGPLSMTKSAPYQGCCCCCYMYPEFFIGKDVFSRANEAKQKELSLAHLEYIEKRTTFEAKIKSAEAEMHGKFIKILKK